MSVNRGEEEKILNVKIEMDNTTILGYLCKRIITNENKYTKPILEATIEDSYKRLIEPAIEREIRNELSEKARGRRYKSFW